MLIILVNPYKIVSVLNVTTYVLPQYQPTIVWIFSNMLSMNFHVFQLSFVLFIDFIGCTTFVNYLGPWHQSMYLLSPGCIHYLNQWFFRSLQTLCDRVQDSHEEQKFWITRIYWVGIWLNQLERFEEHENCTSRWKQCYSRWKQCWMKTIYK